MLSDPERTLERLSDRAEIYDLLTSYFCAIDGRDRETVLALFTDDAHLAINGQHAATGRNAIEAFLGTGRAARGAGVSPTSIRMSHHIMGAPTIAVHGDTASTETYAVAHLILGDTEEDSTVVVRGLRYMDELRRTEHGWRIYDRLHTGDFGMELPALYATTYEDRLTRASWSAAATRPPR